MLTSSYLVVCPDDLVGIHGLFEEETPMVADFFTFGTPVCFVPMWRGSNWCALAVFRALLPGVSLGGPGNWSLWPSSLTERVRGCRL